MSTDYQLVDNQEAKQYQIDVDGQHPRIEYIKAKDQIYLTHTEVPKALEGNGFGSLIIGLALEDIKKKDLTLIPICPFVSWYIKKHPEWRELVLKWINIA